MRALFHFGLFALALTAVSQASADDHRHHDRRTTSVVVAPEVRRAPVRRVRVAAAPPPSRYDVVRMHEREQQRLAAARRDLYEQTRDHDQIVRIRNQWQQATYRRNPIAQRNAERRAYQWIDREIADSRRTAGHGRYVQRLHALRRELQMGHAWPSHPGRGRRFVDRRAEVFDELVTLSAIEVQRARAEVRGGMHPVFARR